jgi:hypothetical protein
MESGACKKQELDVLSEAFCKPQLQPWRWMASEVNNVTLCAVKTKKVTNQPLEV